MSAFKTAAVIGTGMMGPGIAVTLANGGLRTTIVSRSAERAAAGLEKARALARWLAGNGLPAPDLSLLTAAASFESADIVIESAPESMPLKQDLFAALEAAVPADAILASNTSGLSITAIASKCARPERVLTTHFWNPPHLMPLVEIVRGERTAPECAAAVRELLSACGKTAVVIKKDRPGQLGNRLQMALWREAMHIVAEGIADPEDVDLVAKRGFGIRLPVYGMFEHADAVGLEMVLAVMDYVARDLYNQPCAPPLLREMIARGETFYDWSKRSRAEVAVERDRFVLEVLRRSPQRRGDAEKE